MPAEQDSRFTFDHETLEAIFREPFIIIGSLTFMIVVSPSLTLFVFGLILGVVYARTRRVMPLVIAHAILDVVAFVGYQVLSPRLDWL